MDEATWTATKVRRRLLGELEFTMQDWRNEARCFGMDPARFFPLRGRGTPGAVAEAKSVCAPCTVRVECLEFALEANERRGIWGGYTPQERREIVKERNKKAS